MKFQKQTLRIIYKLYVLSLVLVVASCKDNASNSATSDKTPTVEVSNSIYDHPNFSKKYNQYIQYQNSSQSHLNKIYTRYYEKYNPENPLGETNRPVVMALGSITKIAENSKQEPSFGDLDDVSVKVYDAVVHLNNLLKQARSYYHKRENESDNFKKGEEFSKQTEDAFKNYYAVYSTYNALMLNMADELTKRDLEAYKKEGMLVRYNMLASINECDKIIGYINGNEENRANISVEELSTYINSINKYAADLEKLSLDEEAVKKEIGFRYSSVPGYMRELNSFIRECRNFKDRIQNDDWKMPISHPQISAPGSFEKVNGVYKNLITNYNRTI